MKRLSAGQNLAFRTAGALALVAVAAVFWNNVLAAVEARVRARGIMVDAGGHKLHMITGGQDQEGPTVILECGIGGSTASSWAWEERAIQRFAPFVAYDRAGMGASDAGPMPRDGLRLVAELHTALGNAGIKPPYVFVGHSYGGLLARLFTDRYPDEVAGVVLVESARPSSSSATATPMRRYMPYVPLAPWFARLGFMRLYVALAHTDADRLPEPERNEQRRYLSGPHHWNGIVRELKAWGPLTNPEAARTHGFGARPLAILTAEYSAHRWSGWGGLQQEMMKLSSDSIHEIVPGATHGSAVTDSSCAAFVSNAIHDVVTSVRTGRKLREITAGR